MKYITSILILIFFLTSCESDIFNKKEYTGYKPVYMSKEDARTIDIESSRILDDPGKIYLYNHLLFINERREGFHVIDNSDPSNPVKIKFIKVPGCTEISIKSGVLYTNSYTDLVLLDISDLDNISEVKRMKDQFTYQPELTPDTDEHDVYFECVDPEKGYVLKWEKTKLKNPKCYLN